MEKILERPKILLVGLIAVFLLMIIADGMKNKNHFRSFDGSSEPSSQHREKSKFENLKPVKKFEKLSEVKKRKIYLRKDELNRGVETSGRAPVFLSNKIGNTLKKHLDLIDAFGPKAEMHYQTSLNKLRRVKDEATQELWRAYQNIDQERFTERQQIVETLRELRSNLSFNPLEIISMEEIPEEKHRDLHDGSTRLEEGIIRLTAIEGLGQFAKEGMEAALDSLISIISKKDNILPLKRQAVREYLIASDDQDTLLERKKELEGILPNNEHFIITEKVDAPDLQKTDEIPRKIENLLSSDETEHLDVGSHDEEDESPFVHN